MNERAQIAEEVTALWSELVGPVSADPNVTFIEAGGDSLSTVVLFAQVNDRYGVILDVEALMEDFTIRGLTDQIVNSHAAADATSFERK